MDISNPEYFEVVKTGKRSCFVGVGTNHHEVVGEEIFYSVNGKSNDNPVTSTGKNYHHPNH